MERRDFLRAGAVGAAGAVAIGGVGCAGLGEGLPIPAVPMTHAEMLAFLTKLDQALDAVASKKPLALEALSRKLGAGVRYSDKDIASARELVRKSIRSLLVVGSLHDLPEEGRVHPGMQSRLWGHMDEMNDAVIGFSDYMGALPDRRRAAIGRALRDENLGMQVIEALDDDSRTLGVAPERRRHMRAMGTHVCFRMRQSTPALVDECVGTVQKVVARQPTTIEEADRRFAARIGEPAYSELMARTHAMQEAWRRAGVDLDAPLRERRDDEAWARIAPADPSLVALNDKGKRILIAGGIVLGVGAAFGIAGGIVLAAGSIVGAVLLTIGGVHLLAGIITMIVGGAVG